MVKKNIFRLLVSLLILLATGVTQAAVVDVQINLSKQKMDVIVAGHHEFSWDISTARRGYETPTGRFRPNWMTRMHYSEQYEYSPMPHSIFFHQGYAIHATNEIKRLGRPASHGCVRLSPNNARILYDLVELYGMGETKIVVKNKQQEMTAPVEGDFPIMMDEHDL
ncbi:MAG: L,D-transpeptidase [Gammaproteobacteria bacterium]|nr:L,D-transpeptidase [Gammaproteobacteria bacterium]